MKKVVCISIVLFVSAYAVIAAGETVSQDQQMKWLFSIDNSYPKDESDKIQPSKLARLINTVNKLNQSDEASKECARAVARFGELLEKFPDRPETYGAIPTCNLGAENFDALYIFFHRGNEFFKKTLSDDATAVVWESYLQYKMAYLGFLSRNRMDGASKLDIADGKSVDIARRLHRLKPDSSRYNGVLGSLIVANAFEKMTKGMSLEQSLLDEAIALLEPLCSVQKYQQACQDIRVVLDLKARAAGK